VFPDLTVFWVVFLILLTGIILNGLIIRPVLRVVHEREGAVTSARQLAETAAARAEVATAEFESRTQAARAEIYREMDESRRRALERRVTLLAQTRQEAEMSIGQASERIRQQATTARGELEREAGALAGHIVERVLGRKAS
jgi:F0F1-type ATP synthase membrane subunit b/b'